MNRVSWAIHPYSIDTWVSLIWIWSQNSLHKGQTSMDTHLSRGSRGWVGPDPEWQRTGTAAGAGDGAECELHSLVLVPEGGNHWEPFELLTYQKSQQDHWTSQRFQREMGKICLLGRERNEYGQGGCARAPWLCLLGGFGAVLPFTAAYGKFLSSLSVKSLCTVKYKTEKVSLAWWYM